MPIYVHSTDSPLVGIGVRIGVGSIHETPAEEGAAHFLEHLIFKGSRTMPPHQFIKLADELALHDNAYTTTDHTYYYFTGLREVLAEGFENFVDCVKNPALREDDIERERRVVLEEIHLRDSKSNILNFEQLLRMLYPDHPYSRRVCGAYENFEKLPGDAVREFHRKHYRRENVSWLFSGDITADEAEEMVRRFGDFEPAAAEHYQDTQVAFHAAEKHLERSSDQSCAVSCSTRVPVVGDLTALAPYRLLQVVLSSGMSSPLFFRIREQEGLVYSIGAGAEITPLGIQFDVSWNSAYENIERVKTLSTEEIRRIAEQGVSEEQLTVARRKLLMGTMNRNESVDGRLGGMLSHFNDYGRCYDDEEVISIYAAVTAAQVAAAAENLLSGEWVLSSVGNSNPSPENSPA
jgi:predicted Zn-dependent peptidase